MTSHADTLRNRAKWLSTAQSIVVEQSDRDALLAGAAAIDTLTKMQDVLDRLLQERIRHETANSRGPYVTGYWDGVKIAHTWINEALGGTP